MYRITTFLTSFLVLVNMLGIKTFLLVVVVVIVVVAVVVV